MRGKLLPRLSGILAVCDPTGEVPPRIPQQGILSWNDEATPELPHRLRGLTTRLLVTEVKVTTAPRPSRRPQAVVVVNRLFAEMRRRSARRGTLGSAALKRHKRAMVGRLVWS
jgi:hypothetical protein